MRATLFPHRLVLGFGALVVCVAGATLANREARGGPGHLAGRAAHVPCPVEVDTGEWAGTWFWLRSPEQERRIIAGLYNRYCLRCHGADGRGVWDIPDVPDLASARWQAHRSDGQLVRGILEGRGAVMPAFRGTLTLEESWAMARYLRTFVPGTEASRPDLNETGSSAGKPKAPTKGAPASR